jgi:hypothetical protein
MSRAQTQEIMTMTQNTQLLFVALWHTPEQPRSLGVFDSKEAAIQSIKDHYDHYENSRKGPFEERWFIRYDVDPLVAESQVLLKACVSVRVHYEVIVHHLNVPGFMLLQPLPVLALTEGLHRSWHSA